MDQERLLRYGPGKVLIKCLLVIFTLLPTARLQILTTQDNCSFDWECPDDACCMADIRTINHISRRCVQNNGPSSVCGRTRHCTSKPNEGCGPYQGHQCQNFNPNSPLPYYGECKVPPNPCSSNPCLHRGTCIALDTTRFFCQCPSPTFGPQCQFLPQGVNMPPFRPQPPMNPTLPWSQAQITARPNPCLSIPCLNRGTCIALDPTRFFCQCSSPSFGPQCQFLPAAIYFPPYKPQPPINPMPPMYPGPPMYPAPSQFQRPDIPIAMPLPMDVETGSGECDLCKNNAVCNVDSTPICQCRSGFTGEFCQYNVASSNGTVS